MRVGYHLLPQGEELVASVRDGADRGTDGGSPPGEADDPGSEATDAEEPADR